MPKNYYLDTTVFRARLLGHSDIKKLLKSEFKNNTLLTSPFVKMEFERGFIRNLIEFYFILKSQRSISDAMNIWNQGQVREVKNIAEIFGHTFLELNDNEVNKALFRLSEQIKGLLRGFRCLVSRYEKNSANCYLARYEIDYRNIRDIYELERALYAFLAFFKENYVEKCTLLKVFDESKEILNKLKRHTSVNDNFKVQVTNLDNKLSCSNCRTIGDTVIALECPNYAIIITQDKVFTDLCQVIGINPPKVIENVRAIHSKPALIEAAKPQPPRKKP